MPTTYMQGNLALKDNRRIIRQEEQSPNQHNAAPQRQERRSAIPAGEKLFYLAAVLFVVVLLGIVMMRYTMIYQMNAQIKNVQTDIRQAQDDGGSLKQEVEKMSSAERLKDYADKNGFVPLDDQQKLSIGLAPKQTAQTTGKAENKQTGTAISHKTAGKSGKQQGNKSTTGNELALKQP